MGLLGLVTMKGGNNTGLLGLITVKGGNNTGLLDWLQ